MNYLNLKRQSAARSGTRSASIWGLYGMTTRRFWPAAALAIVYVGLWLYLSPYDGLNHDAQGYALQGIAALQPAPLGQDLFLLYRSQEEFSIFSPLYGHVIELLGLDVAAALLTFTFQVLWYVAALLLLRRLLGGKPALLGLGLLLTMPCMYGGLRIFHLAEPFMTARLPAEVLALLGVWAWLGGKRLTATLSLLAAMLIHPLIAFPAVLLIVMAWAAERWGSRSLALLAAAGFILAISGSYLIGGDSPVMQGRWLAVTQMRSRFLFMNQWHTIDLNYALQALLTVLIGATALRAARARQLLLSAFVLGLTGLALSAFYAATVPLEILIQGQPWRWMWPARFLAIGALPAIIAALWSANGMSRAGALFLAAGWLFVVPVATRSHAVVLTSSILMALGLGLVMLTGRVSGSITKVSLQSAWVLLAVILLASVGSAIAAWNTATPAQLAGTDTFPQFANVLRLVTPAAILATGIGVSALYFWTTARGIAIASIGLLLIATAAPTASRAWTARTYTGADYAAFEDWRELIPPSAEVLWWELPRETWFLLDRRAYLTRSQSGGVVFSEQLADEIVRRALVLEPLIDPNFWLGVQARPDTKPEPLTIERLAAICRDPELGFVIWGTDLGLGAPSKDWPTAAKTIFLYDCRPMRLPVGVNGAP